MDDLEAGAPSKSFTSTETVDLIVIGSGVAGMTTAIVAKILGLNVTVLEKTEFIGGTTALSAGAAWLPGNHHVPKESDPRDPLTYVKQLIGGRMDADLVQSYLDHGTRCLDFLEKHTCVRFRMFEGADYRTSVEGASLVGRTVDPVPFDDRALGDLQRMIRPPLPWMTIFHGLQTDNASVHHLQKALRSPRSLLFSIKLLAKHYCDLVRFRRSTRRVRGSALVGMLFKSAVDHDVKIRTCADCKRLLIEGGRVAGVVFEKDGIQHELLARRGVLLASGGFSADRDLRAAHTSFSSEHRSLPPTTNVGDGVKMAISVGARLGTGNISDFCYTPVSIIPLPNGHEVRYPHFSLDRCKPGAIVVAQNGKRFVNEACSYHDFVIQMHAHAAVPAYLIGDRRFLRKYGMGMVHQFPFPYRRYVKNGYLIEAETIAELAFKLDIDSVALADTVTAVNSYALTGIDPEFGKGMDAYSRSLGDPAHAPNPCLGMIAEGPFYAIRLYPGDTGTTCGIVTNANAQVLDICDDPIAGLYACGMDMNNPTSGVHPSSGCNIGPALAFGYAAAQHIAQAAVESRHVVYKYLE